MPASVIDVVFHYSTPSGPDWLWLPVTPEINVMFGDVMLDTREVLARGEIAVPKGVGLRRIQFSNGLFPVNYDDSYCQYGGPVNAEGINVSGRYLPSPKQYMLPKIEYLKRHFTIMKLVMGIWPVSWPMFISSFTARETGGEIDDIYWDMTLTEAVQ